MDTRSFENLMKSIHSKLEVNENQLAEFNSLYGLALVYTNLKLFIPNNNFNRKRLNLISRNLALTIYFAMNGLYEEAQVLLRQILDQTFIIIYAENHKLDKKLLEKGQLGTKKLIKIKSNSLELLNSQLKSDINKLYSKLSNVVHGSSINILTDIISLEVSWFNQMKLGHWKNYFRKTLNLSIKIFHYCFNDSFNELDIEKRAILKENFPL